MRDASTLPELLHDARLSLRVAAITLLLCSGAYTLVVLAGAQLLAPDRSEGSLLRDVHNRIVGSALIAQRFTQDRYLWPRPSAVGCNAQASGGSNLSPTDPRLHARIVAEARRFARSTGAPVPADLVTASGSGLDPHITLTAAQLQCPRVAAARGRSVEEVRHLVDSVRELPLFPGVTDTLVNVLRVNLALDATEATHGR